MAGTVPIALKKWVIGSVALLIGMLPIKNGAYIRGLRLLSEADRRDRPIWEWCLSVWPLCWRLAELDYLSQGANGVYSPREEHILMS
jgi:hypothetical protein